MHEWKEWPHPAEGQSLRQWHDGRCAMCGLRDHVVEDHCHMTGLVRGFLCPGCNISEPHSDSEAWEAWRAWDNPARAFNRCEAYVSSFGDTSISPRSLMTHMNHRERQAWWDANIAASRAGEDWPLPIVLSERAEKDRLAFERELDFIADAVTW